IDNEVTDITTINVDVTPVTLARISFNQDSVFESFKQLAKLAGFIFYVDESKDLHFELRDETDSGIDLTNTNIISSRFDTTREQMANIVWVYGDRYISDFREELTAGAGSVFTLLNKPHNTLVEHLGSPQQGGVFELVSQPISGTNYLVNFHDKQLIFISGTDLGDSIPINGGSIIVTYGREIPIVKFGQNEASISAFGPKTKIIDDKKIKDPITAKDILIKELDNANPFKGIEVEFKGWNVFTPGNTIDVTLNDFDISDTVGIISVIYTFDKNTIQGERVIRLRLDKKVLEVTDALAELKRKLDAIQAQDRQDTDIITRLILATGSAQVVGSKWLVQTRGLGSSFILGKGPHGITGATFGGILGSVVGSGINFLGDSRSGLVINFTGGFVYS
ncbi:MAG: hypothetical protein IH948_00005, partial [Bacteroidetes bacterium]|nr:hypothetical protein [Bacteroidota bacterium]